MKLYNCNSLELRNFNWLFKHLSEAAKIIFLQILVLNCISTISLLVLSMYILKLMYHFFSFLVCYKTQLQQKEYTIF